MSDELYGELPPLKDIEHAIDFVLGSSLSNFPYYRMNPIEHIELRRYIDELLWMGFIREFEFLCHVRVTHT